MRIERQRDIENVLMESVYDREGRVTQFVVTKMSGPGVSRYRMGFMDEETGFASRTGGRFSNWRIVEQDFRKSVRTIRYYFGDPFSEAPKVAPFGESVGAKIGKGVAAGIVNAEKSGMVAVQESERIE